MLVTKEEFLMTVPVPKGSNVRADMTFFETPSGCVNVAIPPGAPVSESAFSASRFVAKRFQVEACRQIDFLAKDRLKKC